ncbi:MAG TPA: hypothetical protein VE932_16455 [Patescibacteria group bacterium]|nr:hypothetical protein [Patescibacteria group bacterium]
MPEVVGITVHLTFARRAYALAAWYRARGARVVLGGLHVLSCPDEAAPHADALAIGDGVQLWPRILVDVERGALAPRYEATWETAYRDDPPPRRDVLARRSFLATTSLIATRGCHNRCGFCYLATDGLRDENLAASRKCTPRAADYARRVRLRHDHGIQVNGSFVLGFDADGPEVFARTADWIEAVRLECATFRILTPYPGTPLFRRLEAEGRLLHREWALYDTAHVVFRPRRMTQASWPTATRGSTGASSRTPRSGAGGRKTGEPSRRTWPHARGLAPARGADAAAARALPPTAGGTDGAGGMRNGGRGGRVSKYDSSYTSGIPKAGGAHGKGGDEDRHQRTG